MSAAAAVPDYSKRSRPIGLKVKVEFRDCDAELALPVFVPAL